MMTSQELFNFREIGKQDRPDYSCVGENSIWITWENQRRTFELSKEIGTKLFRLNFSGPRILRYPVLAFKTLKLINKHQPEFLFVQNPSLILAAVTVFLKPFFKYHLIVDRHTNFMLNRKESLTKWVFTKISDFTLKHTTLTIVTNTPLAKIVDSKGGRSFVLPDPIPEFNSVGEYPLKASRNLCFICTFAIDEPYEEVIAAAPNLPNDVCLYITGNYKSARLSSSAKSILSNSENIVMTGFLPESDYIDLIHSADIIIDLTTFDFCLVCGAYEAIAAEKALVLSDQQVNSDLFGGAPVLVGPTHQEILSGIISSLDELESQKQKIKELKKRYVNYWEESFTQLLHTVKSMDN